MGIACVTLSSPVMRISEAEVDATVPLTLVPSFNWTVACGPASDELHAEARRSTTIAEAILIGILLSGKCANSLRHLLRKVQADHAGAQRYPAWSEVPSGVRPSGSARRICR